jgi:site-specific DNA-cytosine methylase
VARGVVAAKARLGNDEADFENVGGIDIDGAACADFGMLTGKRALQADLHELTPADLLAYAGPRVPDAVISSPPCKGFSQLISKKKALEPKYQRLNELVYRCIFLSCETWSRPPPLIALENVPGIQGRGADVLDRAKRILHAYGYLVHEGTHDCGEIGNLAQHRKRYLLVARLPSSVTAFVHKPPKHRVRACGEVLSQLPMPHGPEAADAGPMHALPNISMLTKVRLALIPPGGDWRDLPPAVQLGVDGSKFRGSPGLFKVVDSDQPWPTVTGNPRVSGSNAAAAVADPRTRAFKGSLGVVRFDQPAGTVAGESLPTNGAFSVADPRLFSPLTPGQSRREVHGRLDVRPWTEAARTVAGTGTNGGYAVADPRIGVNHREGRHTRQYKITGWEAPTGTVTGDTDVQTGALNVADPRPQARRSYNNHYPVRAWGQPALSVIGVSQPDSGAQSVADVRPAKPYRNGQLGVVSWEEAMKCITGNPDVQNGPFACADPRDRKGLLQALVIVSRFNTWNRPISTLELAMLQGLPARLNGKPLVLAGVKTLGWRERIGNAIPEGAAAAIGGSLLLALLASKVGGWFLSNDEIWVRKRDLYPMAAEEAYAL